MGVIEILDVPKVVEAPTTSRNRLDARATGRVSLETTRMFRPLGRVIFFKAASIAAEEDDLTAALERIAEKTRGPTRELAELLDLFSEVGSLGPLEREAAPSRCTPS